MGETNDIFRDRVAIVTGASSGLGRQYALDLAAHGARVVVHGRSDATDAVAEEIRAAGGRAVAVRRPAEDGGAIVAAAIDAFGRVDALIVNAGGTRDRTLAKMSAEEWRDVMSMHLDGAFAAVSAAWPHLAQRGGHIVLTTSGAGLFGRYGQANYSAAKAGLIGLTLALAREGERAGIRVNAVAPWAATGMTRVAFNSAMQDALRADFVSPYVLALCHPAQTESGAVLEVGGGWAAQMRWERARGLSLSGGDLNVETVLARWAETRDFAAGAQHPRRVEDTIAMLGLPAEAGLKT